MGYTGLYWVIFGWETTPLYGMHIQVWLRKYNISPMLHGAAIFTYMTGWFLGHMFINPITSQLKKKLIGGSNPSEKYEFVSWDDDIPNIWRNKIQTTNQIVTNSDFTRVL